jgi:TonB-linked SusC/RagA family outer membrane protein
MMNSVDYASWVNDAYSNMGWGLFFDNDRMAQIQEYHNATPVGPGTRKTADGKLVYGISSNNGSTWADGYGYGIDDVDWYSAVYQNSSFSMEHNASISGGTDAVNYYASFNYLDNNGFMRLQDDKFNRYTGTVKLGVKITDWVSMNLNSRWARTDFERPASLTSSLYSDIARQGWPVLPLYDRNGYLYSSPSPGLGLATGGNDTTQRDILTQQIGFVFEPIKDWKTHVDFTYRTDNTTRHWGSQMTYNHDVNGDAIVYNQSSNVYEGETKENYYNLQAYTEYTKQLGKHNLHAMIGFQAEQLKQLTFSAQRNGILDSSRPEIDLTSGLSYSGSEIVPSVSGARNQWQTAGFFGRLNYNFDERYLLEFNVRRDGTSRFRRDRMWKTFPSVSLGWNIARESFWQDLQEKVNTLKLRASYGSLGNQNTDNWYQTYQTVTYSPSSGSWLQDGKKPNTTSAPSLVSSSLTWERIESYDVGLDFGLLNNRLTGSFDYYIRNTKDMVGNAPELPSILGTDVPVTNNTDLRTSGWEFQLTWRDRLESGLSYGATFNISDARTKITRYPNNPTGDLSTYIEGRYINEIWGYETVGLARTDAEMNAHLATVDQSSLGDNWAAGDIMYADLNGDGKISSGSYTIADHGDLKVIGNSTPRYLVGLDLNAAYKGFDLRLFFQGVMKRDYACTSDWSEREYLFGTTNSGVWWASGLTTVQDYFRDENTWSVQNGYREANTDAWLPRVLYSSKNLQAQTRYLLNAAYVRLKNLQVGYTLPKSLLQHSGLQNVRFNVSVENLFTFTSLPDQFDPELLGYDNNNGYPLSRTWSFGVNVTF